MNKITGIFAKKTSPKKEKPAAATEEAAKEETAAATETPAVTEAEVAKTVSIGVGLDRVEWVTRWWSDVERGGQTMVLLLLFTT